MPGDYYFSLCSREDDKKILSILDSSPFGRDIKLVNSTRPSFFNAIEAFGESNYVVGVRESSTNNLIGFGSVNLQKRYFDGEIHSIGYMSHTRIKPEHRGKGITSKAFSYLKKNQDKFGADFFITSIASDNKLALKIFTNKRKDYPYFFPLGEIFTKIIKLKKKKVPILQYNVSSLRDDHVTEVISFLNQAGKEKDLFPKYKSLKNEYLNISDFVIVRKKDELVGVCAIWDQRKFKQIIVKKYGGKLKIIDKILRSFSLSYLPEVDKPLPLIYVSHLCIKGNNSDILHSMINFIQNKDINPNTYMCFGIDVKDPLKIALKKYHGKSYKTKLFMISWDDLSAIAAESRKRVFYPEIALF
tara:strand:+ start:9153 stop:10226 length:1074 start_codon:yes stop_codon:yes gene_type:complete